MKQFLTWLRQFVCVHDWRDDGSLTFIPMVSAWLPEAPRTFDEPAVRRYERCARCGKHRFTTTVYT